MALQNCPTCLRYWLDSGRNLYGYRFLIRGKHIPKAHPTAFSETSSSQLKPDLLQLKSYIIEQRKSDPSWYFPLYRAAVDGDWEKTKSILDRHGEDALRAKNLSGTALHVAVGRGPRTIIFVRKLLERLTEEDLEAKNIDGCTPLDIAARAGNVEAAKALVEKHPQLLYIPSSDDSFPIHSAAEYGHKEMLLYLLEVTQQGQCPDPYDPIGSGPKLLCLIIQAEFYDVALHLVKRMPELVVSGKDPNQYLLTIAKKPSAFSCWRSKGVFLPIIYACMPELPQKQSYRHITLDIENAASEQNLSGLQKIHQVLWGTFEKIAPVLKHIKSEKLKGHQAKELVKCLCQEAAIFLKTSTDTVLLFKIPLLRAAENGIPEIVKEITDAFPEAVWCDGDVFRLAIENRHHEVYNLLFEMDDIYVDRVSRSIEEETGDNILHLAGRLAACNQLSSVPCAPLRMQRELQWFKEIESLVKPSYKSKRNNEGKTPQEVFTECHKKVMSDEKKWVRRTASSYAIGAVVFATVSFVAAIKVPRLSDNDRQMLGLERRASSNMFEVANAISLFSSCASVLMFLSILTSRYEEGDFLRAVPARLIIGFLTLFIFPVSMMVALSSRIYLMRGHGHQTWILGCVIVLYCVLVSIILGEAINNAFLSGVFRKRSKSKSPIWSSFFKKLN
ncbi:unnamed protein product [Rhodiola kirilowii]